MLAAYGEHLLSKFSKELRGDPSQIYPYSAAPVRTLPARPAFDLISICFSPDQGGFRSKSGQYRVESGRNQVRGGGVGLAEMAL